MKKIILIIALILIGFISGYFVFNTSTDKRIEELNDSISFRNIQLSLYKDSIFRYEVKNKKLKEEIYSLDSFNKKIEKELDSLYLELKDTSNLEKTRKEYEKINNISNFTDSELQQYWTDFFLRQPK